MLARRSRETARISAMLMIVESILSKGKLREMLVGRTPDDSSDDCCFICRHAVIVCPVKNIAKLDKVLPEVVTNKTQWMLRAGCWQHELDELARRRMLIFRANMRIKND